MNVADLQQLLDDVGRLLSTAGARATPLAELAAFREGLAPFRDLPLKKLTDLLAQADAAARGVPPAPRGGRRSSGSSQARPDTEAMVREVRALYDRATDPTLREEDIAAVMARLTPLTKDALLSVATGVDLKLAKSKSKEAVLGEIRQRIAERRSVHQRSKLLGRPGEGSHAPQSATGTNGSSGSEFHEPDQQAAFTM